MMISGLILQSCPVNFTDKFLNSIFLIQLFSHSNTINSCMFVSTHQNPVWLDKEKIDM